MIREFWQYKNLVRELVVRDIKKKYRRSILGVIWSMLNPLLMMLITAMVFSHLFRFEIKNFPLYLLSGQIIFTFFAEATNFAMGSILENSALIKKVYVPKFLFPLSRVMSSLVNLFFTIPALLIVMLVTGASFHWMLLLMVFPLCFLFIFCLGIGLLLAAFAVYFRDLFHLYGVLLATLNYATPIFYPEKIIPEYYRFVIDYNPLYYYLHMFRDMVYSNTWPSIDLWVTCIIFSILSLLIGGYAFAKKQNQFILYV